MPSWQPHTADHPIMCCQNPIRNRLVTPSHQSKSHGGWIYDRWLLNILSWPGKDVSYRSIPSWLAVTTIGVSLLVRSNVETMVLWESTLSLDGFVGTNRIHPTYWRSDHTLFMSNVSNSWMSRLWRNECLKSFWDLGITQPDRTGLSEFQDSIRLNCGWEIGGVTSMEGVLPSAAW